VSVPSTAEALSALARVTLRRTLRRKAVWIALAFALLPRVFVQAMGRRALVSHSDDAFNVTLLLLAVVPPLFVAGAIGEEIEDRTATYLWSRPLARWTLVVGKLLVLAPLAVAVVCAGWILASLSVDDSLVLPLRTTLAIGAGALAISVVSAGIATLVPKHGMALTIVYVLADLTIGALPISLSRLSVTKQAGVIATFQSDTTTIAESAAAMAAIAAVWLIVALRRIRRLEA
jgi:ABC-type transport system involved in multi-copper enzyme maturation permease subunit